MLDIEVADAGEDHRTDEIHEQILHGVDDADVQIASQTQCFFRAVGVNDDHIADVPEVDDDVGHGGIQIHGVDGVNDRVLLHVHAEEIVSAEFKKLPQNPHSHRKAEGDDGQIQGRQLNGEPLVPVEHVHQGEADGGAQKAVDGVQHGIPVGHPDVEAVQLPQYFRRENEQQNDDLQGVRQDDFQLFGEDAGHEHQHQGQGTQEHAFILCAEYSPDENKNNQGTQSQVNRQSGFVFVDRVNRMLVLLHADSSISRFSRDRSTSRAKYMVSYFKYIRAFSSQRSRTLAGKSSSPNQS